MGDFDDLGYLVWKIVKWPLIAGAVIGGGIAWYNCSSDDTDATTNVSSVTQVESGYILPSELEVQVDDLNDNGVPETYLKIGDQRYGLKRNEHGKPSLYHVDLP